MKTNNQQRKKVHLLKNIHEHLSNNKRSMNDEWLLIKTKQSKLSAAERELVITEMNKKQ